MNDYEFIQWCYERHDVICNQKYDKVLPYSCHLKFVRAQVKKFIHLLPQDTITRDAVMMGAAGHDLIEDARVTYNDLLQNANATVAEIIFLCTEMRGRNRGTRKSEQFFEELKVNRLATFVKLCDVIANVTYSILTGSNMIDRYKDEYPKVKRHLYCENLKPMFDHLEALLAL